MASLLKDEIMPASRQYYKRGGEGISAILLPKPRIEVDGFVSSGLRWPVGG